MSINPKVASMQAYFMTEIPTLCAGITPQPLRQDKGVIYEAYLFTCMVEAIEKLTSQSHRSRVAWRLVCPSGNANTLVLTQKAGNIRAAANRYSHAHVNLGSAVYELHTDVRVHGRSGILHELDIALVRAEACEAIRHGYQEFPRWSDVALFIEAKCYDPTLELGLGRGFLGLARSELPSNTIGYLASPAQNERISTMISHHGRRRQKFWPLLDDRRQQRNEFILDVVSRLSEVSQPPKPAAAGRTRTSRATSTTAIQPALPGMD